MANRSPAASPSDAAVVADELAATVWDAATSFRGIDPATAAERPAPGKWSPREIVGHLIDSASNNHQRFVRAQEAADQSFPGYAQDHWVRAQDYQARDWEALIDLWQAYNLHLAHVIRAIPPEALETRLRVGGGEPVTLGWLVAGVAGGRLPGAPPPPRAPDPPGIGIVTAVLHHAHISAR